MFGWIKRLFGKQEGSKIQMRIELNNGTYYEEDIAEDNLTKRIGQLVEQDKKFKTTDEIAFIWCLVGNIVGEHYAGTEKVIRYGTKRFSPNTKVYCFPILWGDGYDSIKVLGKHRKSKRNICLIMRSKFITNWRIQKVYNPNIIKEMHLRGGWGGTYRNSEEDREYILQMLKWLPEKTLKS